MNTLPPVLRHIVRDQPWVIFNYGVAAGLCIWAVQACLAPISPAKQAADAKVLLECVQKDWGQPVLVIATDCTTDSVILAEDVIADVEALLEGPLTDAGTGSAASSAQAALFPYNTAAVRAKVDAKRSAMHAR